MTDTSQMKSTYRLLALLIFPLLAWSCADEPMQGEHKLPPGTPVEISIAMDTPKPLEAVAGSRAAADAQLNRQVFDFYLFIFDENDRVTDRYFFPTVSDTPTLCDPSRSTHPSAMLRRLGVGRAELTGIHTTTGRRRIMGVGNVDHIGAAQLLGSLDKITTADELRTLNSGANNTDASIFVMSGDYRAADGSTTGGSVYIDGPVLAGTIILEPMKSRFLFEIDGNGEKAPEGSDMPDGVFTLEEWQVYRLPSEATLWRPQVEGSHTSATPFNSVAIRQFTQNYQNDPNKRAFVFFSLGNLPAPKEGATFTGYGSRAEWTGPEGASSEEKVWTNAPDGATFVVMRGSYKGASKTYGENTVRNVNAKVTYTVFLGHNSDTDFSDFRTMRNYNYTYKIHVKGVDRITVEVISRQDVRPGSEGHVVVSESETELLDAHYCQRTIRLRRSQIASAVAANQLGARAVVPPLGKTLNYSYNPDDTDETTDFSAFSWIEAYIHKPDDPEYVSYTRARGSAARKATLTVKQMLDAINEFATADGAPEDVLTVTLFFDEYLYDDVDWKRTANSDERTFSIMGTTTLSPDGNSSITTGGTTFRQVPIRTVYDITNPEIARGWGMESIEEPLRADGSTTIASSAWGGDVVPGGASTRYGRQNFWRQIYYGIGAANALPWSKHVDDNGFLKYNSTHEKSAACLLRNRDLNGNGKVDADEVRWYTPSIQQLQELYVCRNVIPAEYRLYNPTLERPHFNGNRWRYKHYISSSAQILWGEEGGSTGPMPTAADHPDAFHIRCVRDLGTFLGKGTDGIPYNIQNNPQSQFQSVLKVHEPDEGREHVGGRVTLEGINPAALRRNLELVDIRGNVTTFSALTAPATSFEWADTIINVTNAVSMIDDNAIAANDSILGQTMCNRTLGRGWRLPTLSEMIVLWWHLGEGIRAPGPKYHVTRTQYEYFNTEFRNPTGQARRSHVVDFENAAALRFVLTNDSEKNKERGGMRCVRDYIP